MKKFVFLFCFVLLFSGCNNSTPAENSNFDSNTSSNTEEQDFFNSIDLEVLKDINREVKASCNERFFETENSLYYNIFKNDYRGSIVVQLEKGKNKKIVYNSKMYCHTFFRNNDKIYFEEARLFEDEKLNDSKLISIDTETQKSYSFSLERKDISGYYPISGERWILEIWRVRDASEYGIYDYDIIIRTAEGEYITLAENVSQYTIIEDHIYFITYEEKEKLYFINLKSGYEKKIVYNELEAERLNNFYIGNEKLVIERRDMKTIIYDFKNKETILIDNKYSLSTMNFINNKFYFFQDYDICYTDDNFNSIKILFAREKNGFEPSTALTIFDEYIYFFDYFVEHKSHEDIDIICRIKLDGTSLEVVDQSCNYK